MTITTAAGKTVLPGDFAAVRVHGDVGKMIEIGEWLNGSGFGNWEHAIFYAGGPDDLCLEAEPGGALLIPYRYRDRPADVLWSTGNPALELTAQQRGRALPVAELYKGTPYSALDYDALALHRLHIPAPGLRGYIQTTKHMICSQMTDQCRLRLGSHLFTDPPRWPGYVVPLDLAKLIDRAAALSPR